MAETPGKRRKRGREAFDPLVDPMDIQPYKKGTWGYEHHFPDWLEGWKSAEAAFKQVNQYKCVCWYEKCACPDRDSEGNCNC